MRSPQNSAQEAPKNTKLLRRFDRIARRARPRLDQLGGEALAEGILRDARAGYEKLIPELPDIGGSKNQFTKVIEINGWIVSLYRAMKAEGRTTEEVVRVCCEVADDLFQPLPSFVRRLLGRLGFSHLVKRRMQKQAASSQLQRYPADFVYTFQEEVDGGWSLRFSECAVNKFYEAQGAEELKPYCNFFDVTYSRHLEMGIDATRTIGLGCETCTLAYRRGRETAIPPRLRGLLPRT